MPNNGVGRRVIEADPDRLRGTVVLIMRRASLCTDGAALMALLLGRQDALGCAGALSTVLRCVRDLIDVPS
jgi:hypothetical protein